MPLSYLRYGYARNPYELEARHAVQTTRAGDGSAAPSSAP
jgi:hypothetical protein